MDVVNEAANSSIPALGYAGTCGGQRHADPGECSFIIGFWFPSHTGPRPPRGSVLRSWEVEADLLVWLSSPAVAVHHIDTPLLARLYRHRRFLPTSRTLFTPEPRADLLPRCRRCLQPTPLIHDQRIRRVRERDLFDRQVWFTTACSPRRLSALWSRPVNISTGSSGSRLTRRMQCWIEALVQYLPSAMSASSPGSVGTPSGSTSAVCRPVWAPSNLGRCGGW